MKFNELRDRNKIIGYELDLDTIEEGLFKGYLRDNIDIINEKALQYRALIVRNDMKLKFIFDYETNILSLVFQSERLTLTVKDLNV